MTDERAEATQPFTLRRWSRRKLQARAGAASEPARGASLPAAAADGPPSVPAVDAIVSPESPPADGTALRVSVDAPGVAASGDRSADASPLASNPASAMPAVRPGASDADALPDLATLSFESDFSRFLRPGVDEAVKRSALAKLFRDPRFNVMDGLDVYVDDYTAFEPLAPEVARSLAHARHVFDPPPTRIDEHGWVVDAPDEGRAASGERAGQASEALPGPAGAASRALEPGCPATETASAAGEVPASAGETASPAGEAPAGETASPAGQANGESRSEAVSACAGSPPDD